MLPWVTEPQNLNERKFVLFFGSCTQGIFISTSGVLKLGSGILESGVLVSWGPANRACHPLVFNELLGYVHTAPFSFLSVFVDENVARCSVVK